MVQGHRVADPYRWLEDARSSETQRWSADQDERFAREAERWAGRACLRRRLGELLAHEVVSPPVWRGGRQFLVRRRPDAEHAVLLVVDGGERVLLDPMVVDPTGLTTLDAWQPSVEGELLAVQTSVAGTEEARLVVLDVATGATVEGPIGRVRYSPVAWLPGGAGFYYVRSAGAVHGRAAHRGVFLHWAGRDPADDVMVFPPDPQEPTRPGVSVTPEGRWLTVSVSYGTGRRNDLWLADLGAGAPEAPAFAAVQHGEDVVTAPYIGPDGRLYLLTNRDAPRNRLCVTTPERLSPPAWEELVPEAPDANLEEVVVLEDPATRRPQLLLAWARHAASELAVHDAVTGALLSSVALPGDGTAHHLTAPPGASSRAWFEYTDVLTPPWVWCYDAGARTATPWRPRPAVARPPAVQTARVEYRSDDGTPVRLSLMGPPPGPDHPRPTILHAYGGFGEQRRPGFTASILAWIEAGGVYAVAHVRGGGEEGTAWHHAGTLDGKQKTFDDFAAAARWLVANGWTTVDRLCFSGGSNGGLVVTAAMTQHPELCQAVMATTPLTDMVRYEHHGLGRLWTREYGTARDPQHLSWLLAYSPYHHVTPSVDYPATLFNVFDQDTRVDPLHARKMCAALQWATGGHRPIVLRREADVGHSSRALSRAIALAADALCFAAHFTGLGLPQPSADTNFPARGEEVMTNGQEGGAAPRRRGEEAERDPRRTEQQRRRTR